MTDPQSIPASGEQHERAVEAALRSLFCRDYDDGWTTADRKAWVADQSAVIDAYFASLREQGVRLVDLREVVEREKQLRWALSAAKSALLCGEPMTPQLRAVIDDTIERRFGGNEGSE